MEGGKPGWYDALNGMPGMFGSSMNESYELLRMIRFTKEAISKFDAEITLPTDSIEFIESLKDIETRYTSDFDLWDNRNAALEGYRDEVYGKLFDEEKTISSEEAVEILGLMEKRLEKGVSKAFDLGKGIAPGYFTFEVPEYDKKEDGIYPKSLKVQNVPYFLEGPVRFFKLENTYDEKKKIYDRIKDSDLFDKKLSMYKVNASLENASFEFGRCKSSHPDGLRTSQSGSTWSTSTCLS